MSARIDILFPNTGTVRPAGPEIIWRASKADLTELIYALVESQALGAGLDIKSVSEILQQAFGIHIANIYATYEDIRLRKKNRTPFMDSLKTALIRRIDNDDLYAP
ncbi:RteC domain-containing protein [Chitinophaga sedimenti]|uniref:RteC domain-containing protein n=1 Tax=Chitinophaga sedimenti TaxID=2033606 RepID=UPI00249F786A|nr:RteC domain-containing protein [Chitinophaga sedimenti]